LGYLKAIYYGIIVNADIQHSSLRVQEGRDVFHDDCGDAVIDDISEVFELVMSILDYGQSLPALKVGVGCVPLLVCLAFAFLDALYDELLLFVFDFRHILYLLYLFLYDGFDFLQTGLELVYFLLIFR